MQSKDSGQAWPKQTVTLKQVASAVGVSVATVSRVLSFDATLSVSTQTRQAIVETAAALNYAPPRQRKKAAAIAKGKIALIHFLRPEQELADPYYVSMRLGIEKRSAELLWECVKIYQTERFPDASLLREVSGLLVVGWHSDDEVRWLVSQNRNIVFADFSPDGDGLDSVESNLVVATGKLLSSLVRLGHRRIAFAGWTDRLPRGGLERPEKRCVAFRNWMTEAGLFDPTLCLTGTNTEESGFDLALRMLDRVDRPDALVTANDNMAVGAYRAIHKLGVRVPDDISVASFNDISAARYLTPPLTTVRLPAEAIGENAVDLLVERLAGRELAKRVTLESKIIWRGSTKQPN